VGNIHSDYFFNDLIQIVALIHLQTHSIMNLVVGEGDVVLEDVIPGIGKGGNAIIERKVKDHGDGSYHFFSWILDASVPICAAISFLRSPTVSSGLHFTRTGGSAA
jgi:hypothetical protein